MKKILTVGPISIGDTLVKRIVCTLIGILISIIAELVIYRDAASAKPAIKQNTDNYFQTLGEIISLVSDYFISGKHTAELRDKIRNSILTLIASISSIEQLHLNIIYEFDYKEDQERFYQCFFRYTADIDRVMRKIIGIVTHDKYNSSILCSEELMELSINISEKYKNILHFFEGETDNLSECILYILKRMELPERTDPAYLYIKSLYNFSILADDLSSAVYNRKFK